ncbi:hypothetical protein [Chryseobacterium shandongense]|nr:hypothetical protein [Chryseobacterium shandongense]
MSQALQRLISKNTGTLQKIRLKYVKIVSSVISAPIAEPTQNAAIPTKKD